MNDFTGNTVITIKEDIVREMYSKAIKKLEKFQIPYSVSGTYCMDMSNNHKCCCGDRLVPKPTNFSYLAMYNQYGIQYTSEQLKEALGDNIHQGYYLQYQQRETTPNLEINRCFYDIKSNWSPVHGLGKKAITTSRQKLAHEKKRLRSMIHDPERYIAEYSQGGDLLKIYEKTDFSAIQICRIREKAREEKKYNNKYYKFSNVKNFPEKINFDYFCIVGDKKYYSSKEV